MDREPPVPPTPVPGRQGAAGSAYVYVESSDSKNYVDVPPPDPGRRYRAERLINRLSSQNQYLWVSYEGPTEAEARDVIRHHMTSTGAEPISEGTAAEIRELRAEIIAELFRLDRVAPPRGLNVAGFPPTYRRPMAAPRPAEVPPKCATERLVVELAGCGDLGMVEPAARAMIEFTRDERAKQTGRYQAVSIKRHMKWMRLLVEGTVEAGVIVEAMDQARSATAMNPASCYFDRLEKVYPQFAPEGAKRGGRASRQSPTAAPGESQRHP